MNNKRAIIFLAALLFLTTAAQSTDTMYNIDLFGQPYDYSAVSPNSTSYQFVNLTYDGTPVREENLVADGGTFFYNYPASDSNNITLEHFKDGLWLAKIDTNTSTYDINYTVKNESSDSLHIWAEKSDSLTVSEMDLDKKTTINDPVKAGKTITFKTNLTNTTSSGQIDNADVQIRFSNGTLATEIVNIGYNDADNLYRTSLDIPDYTDQTFIGQIKATHNGQTATESFRIHTKLAIDGHTDYLRPTAGGCRSGDITTECEGGATMETGFNVTDDTAESVNLTIIKLRNDGTEEVYKEISLNRDGSIPSSTPGYYTGNFDFPYINKSTHQNQVKFMFNASSDNREHIVNQTITYRSFRANIDLERSYAYQSGDFKIPLTIGRYFSLETILEEDIKELDVNITDPDGEMFASYNLSNVSLGPDEQYTETIQIPGNAQLGDYQIDLFVEDVYNAEKTLIREFSVRSTDQTFEVNETSITKSFDRAGQYTSSIEVADISDTGVNISTEVSDSLQNVVDISDNFQISPGVTSQIGIDWNFSQVQDRSGYIRFVDEDSTYNTTVDVELNAPNCQIQSGPLCSLSDQSIEYTMTERSTDQMTLELLNIGEEGSQREVTTSISGNITDVMSVKEAFNFQNRQEIPINFTPQQAGTYTGTLTISDGENIIEYDVTLNSEVPSGAAQADITNQIQLGSLVTGESASAEIEIENTGETTIENITVNSSDYSIQADTEGLSIEPGNTVTVSIDFSNVQTESGQLEVELEAIKNSTETVSVSATVYSDYGERVDTLFNDIRNLRDSTGNQEALSTLDQAEKQLDSAQISWENGNYQETVNSYEQADELYTQAQNTVESQQPNQEPGSGTGDPGTDPGTQEPADSGGLPILPIVAIVFILIVGGFIFYESYIPEEGDPLYDVLGQ